jgi:hypothetical protein
MANTEPKTITAVEECSRWDCAARVMFGTPLRRLSGDRGHILLFGPCCVVAYRIRQRRYSFGCVFRTAETEAISGDVVPGVSPAPVLLAGFLRGGHFARALLLLRELRRRGIADTISNESYLRAAVALARPHVDVCVLAEAMEAAWTC